MTDNWNQADGNSPHDKAANYATAGTKSADDKSFDFSQDYAKLYEAGISLLRQNRFYLDRSPLGAHCMHDAFIRTKPKLIKGISYPSWFKVLQLLETEDDESELASAMLMSESATYEVQQFWAPLTQPLSGQKSTPLQGYVERLLRIDENRRKQNESIPFEPGIQISNFTEQVAKTERAPRAHIPPREWFDEDVQKLTFADVFTLWPKPETDMLKLIIGRTFMGRSSNKLVGEPNVVEHTFRSVGIVIGEDAGLGKSTIFDKLAKATNKTGYRWTNFRNIGEQFGLGAIITSDVAYKDDLTGKTLADLVRSENTKIIASGGRMFVEDKFQKGASLSCQCTLLANTNEWDPRLVYGMDSGTVDRIKLLTTYRRAELHREAKSFASDIAKGSPNFAPFVHLPWLAKKLGVDEECLLLWACRLAVDEFNALTFRQGEVPTETLRLAIHTISSRLKYNFNKDCTRAIISSMVLAHVLVSHLPDRIASQGPYEMRELSPAVLKDCFTAFRCLVTDKALFRVREIIKLHWEQNDRPDTHPWSGIRKLNFLSVKEAESKLNNAVASRQPLSEQVNALFGSLRLRDGFTGSKDIVWVTAAWQACQGYTEDIESLGRVIDDIVMKHQDQMRPSAVSLSKALRGISDDNWLDASEYTPNTVEQLLHDESKGFDVNEFAEYLGASKWMG